MSQCTRCGATFHCAMADTGGAADAGSVDAAATTTAAAPVSAANPAAPCWCTALPALLPVPQAGAAGCWCPDCLRAEIAAQLKQQKQQQRRADPI